MKNILGAITFLIIFLGLPAIMSGMNDWQLQIVYISVIKLTFITMMAYPLFNKEVLEIKKNKNEKLRKIIVNGAKVLLPLLIVWYVYSNISLIKDLTALQNPSYIQVVQGKVTQYEKPDMGHNSYDIIAHVSVENYGSFPTYLKDFDEGGIYRFKILPESRIIVERERL